MNRFLEHDWFPEPLPENVLLGERTWLYSTFAFRHYQSRRPLGLRAGHDTGLYNGTFFDLGPTGEISIGSYCSLVGVIICCNRRVEIGDYVFMAHDVVIADSFAAVPGGQRHGNPLPATTADSQTADSQKAAIVIGDNVWIGARAVLLGDVRIGEGSIVGAAAVVDFPVPPYSVVAGNPARIVKTLRH